MLYFITGNENKFEEVKSILSIEIEQLDIDLPEIQEIDPHKVLEAKLLEAFNHHEGEFIVEDTSLYLDTLNGLPGPLIKWFQKTIGLDGLTDIAEKLGDNGGEARVVIGYAKNKDEMHFFSGTLKGTIVKERGENGFGWDPIFQPGGYDKTFAEMTDQEKNEVSMRKIAVEKLKKFMILAKPE